MVDSSPTAECSSTISSILSSNARAERNATLNGSTDGKIAEVCQPAPKLMSLQLRPEGYPLEAADLKGICHWPLAPEHRLAA